MYHITSCITIRSVTSRHTVVITHACIKPLTKKGSAFRNTDFVYYIPSSINKPCSPCFVLLCLFFFIIFMLLIGSGSSVLLRWSLLTQLEVYFQFFEARLLKDHFPSSF